MYIFVVSNCIHNLVTYLQEFRSLGLPNANHTTLLLNTYTKLKDIVHLDSFIRDRKSGDDDTDELPFDPDIAIPVCPQAGYFKQERHEDYLRIQIEDARNFMDALMHLRKLDPEVVSRWLFVFPSRLGEPNSDEHFPLHRQRNFWRSMGIPCWSLLQKTTQHLITLVPIPGHCQKMWLLCRQPSRSLSPSTLQTGQPLDSKDNKISSQLRPVFIIYTSDILSIERIISVTFRITGLVDLFTPWPQYLHNH